MGRELSVLSQDEVVTYPLDRAPPDTDPQSILEAAEADALLDLDGFELTVP